MNLDVLALLISGGALIVSALGYRYAKNVKSTDLRIEAKKSLSELKQKSSRLRASHSGALDARKALNSALGILNSGTTQKYTQRWEKDKSSLDDIERGLSELEKVKISSSHSALEKLIIAANDLRIQIDALQAQYDSDEEENERNRSRILESRKR